MGSGRPFVQGTESAGGRGSFGRRWRGSRFPPSAATHPGTTRP